MGTDPEVKLQSGGAQPTRPTPNLIRESGKARNALLRTWFGGGVLIALCLAYVAALIWREDEASTILPVIGTGLGFLLGQSRSKSSG
jgi:hypothetical protein